MCYGKKVSFVSVSKFVVKILINVSFLQYIYIYGRNDMCYGKTIPCGSVLIFVIQIMIYVPFLTYIYGRKDMWF